MDVPDKLSLRKWLEPSSLDQLSLHEKHLKLFFVAFSSLTLIFAGIETLLTYLQGELIGAALIATGVAATAINLMVYKKSLIKADRGLHILLIIFTGFYAVALITGLDNKLAIYWVGFFSLVTVIAPALNIGLRFMLAYLVILGVLAGIDFLDIYHGPFSYEEYRQVLLVILGSSMTGVFFNLAMQGYRHTLEQERTRLIESESRFRDVSDSSNDWIWELDSEVRYTYVSPGISHILGYAPEEVLGKTPFDFMPPEEAARLAPVFSDIMNCRQAFKKLENTNLHKNGSRVILETSGKPIVNEKGELTGYRGTDTDISDRKAFTGKLEQTVKERTLELEKAMAQADEANQAKSSFLANMSHEIRTPLNAIIGMANLASKTELTEQQKNYIEKLQLSSEALLRLINDILDFSKIEAGQLEFEHIPFSLNELMQNFASMIKFRAEEKNIEFLFELAEHIPDSLRGDPYRLQQVLTNLGTNAVKFTEPGGEIIVKVNFENIRADRVRLFFSVQDSGIGISAEQAGKLFRSFSQADSSTTRKFGGTGLGLVICKHLVEAMQGQIGVNSETGKGSDFHFHVELDCLSEEYKRLSEMNLRGLKMLVVDDLLPARSLVRRILRPYKVELTEVASASEALALIKQADGEHPFQLALVDWKMPGMDGLDLVSAIYNDDTLANRPATIIVTGGLQNQLIDMINQDSLLKAHISGIVTKPYLPDDLLEAIGKAMHLRQIAGKADKPIEPLENHAIEKIQGAHVLLVEDNLINQELAFELLQQVSVTATIANNGQEALDILQQESFDAVLMDCQMPLMDGYEATRRIRQQDRFESLPVIAMTANVMRKDIEQMLEAGMNDHIAKPVDPQMMFNTLAKWVVVA